jgi:hypothetical protein
MQAKAQRSAVIFKELSELLKELKCHL